ncbi:hypothetical protein [Miniphocaeibacter halophilus]|nr:hypothetical protein [Miniphocaeibacter halophilus]
MINEVVPEKNCDNFYAIDNNSAYMDTTKILFEKSGHKVNSIKDI